MIKFQIYETIGAEIFDSEISGYSLVTNALNPI